MKQVYPLSLSPEVVAMLQLLPKGERSRKADAVLKAHLRLPSTAQSTLDEPRIRAIVRQILAEQRVVPSDPGVLNQTEEDRTLSALSQILGMRSLEGDTAEDVQTDADHD